MFFVFVLYSVCTFIVGCSSSEERMFLCVSICTVIKDERGSGKNTRKGEGKLRNG